MRRRLWPVLGLVALIPLVVAAVLDARGPQGSGARSALTIIVPADAGGGWDTAARTLQQAMREHDVVTNPQVVNVPGASGTIGLSQLMQMGGREDVVMVTGTVMLGGSVVNDSRYQLAETTPLTRITEDYEVVVVPADSPYRSFADLAAAWRADPGGTVVGGGSVGGTDHILAALMAKQLGIDPAAMNYVAYSGGGEALTSLLTGTSEVGVSGYSDFSGQIESGTLRALAISAPQPQPELGIPTLFEAGVPVHLPNWRGVVTVPGASPQARAELEAILRETMATPTWATALATNSWYPAPEYGDGFGAFVRSESDRITTIIEESGL